MLTYEETMAAGQASYQDVLDDLRRAGHHPGFTQTGGMSAALEVELEAGWSLLLTDAEDSLPWSRRDQTGWGVALYAPHDRYDGPATAWATRHTADTPGLLQAIDEVLRSVVRAGRA